MRVLFLSDTHLGADGRGRGRERAADRSLDSFAVFERALAPAFRGEVDLVVHGGDLLYRSRVPDSLVERAFAPLARVADAGVPVFVVPGNHERSRFPLTLWTRWPGVHVFDRPRTFVIVARGQRVALTGFPFERHDVRGRFRGLLEAAGVTRADLRLLCLHHCVEGATVGPVGFTFRRGRDVIRCADLPEGFAAVLAGHVHRHQVLVRDLRGAPLRCPVLYAGATRRTSSAERLEDKGSMRLDFADGVLRDWRFDVLAPSCDATVPVRGPAFSRPEASVPEEAAGRLRARPAGAGAGRG